MVTEFRADDDAPQRLREAWKWHGGSARDLVHFIPELTGDVVREDRWLALLLRDPGVLVRLAGYLGLSCAWLAEGTGPVGAPVGVLRN